MRISDWSSDVCSSDLRQELSIAQSRAKKSDPDFVDRIGDAPQIPAGDAAIRGPLPGDFQRARLGHRLALVVAHVDAAAQADIIHRAQLETEIRRPPCRESVGQYVKHVVVAVDLKKK